VVLRKSQKRNPQNPVKMPPKNLARKAENIK
jgi:hypothetical protein